ncbi:MAG: translocation/assembly module TamB domain-containing protein, partial [Tannerellaceae bacterium]
VSMINTTFALDSQNIAIENSVVHFNKFSLIPPNKNLMTMDGTINLENLENILTDLSIKATNFQVIDVSQKASSMIFGKAYVDLNTTIKGSLSALMIRGNMTLLGNTDVTYVMQNSPLQVNDKTAQLVQFVSFRDTSEVDAIPLLKAQTGGLDLLFTSGINDAAQAGIYLSDDGSNRIEIQGGGNLVYQASPEGSTSFTGRYSVTGGTVVYNPPIISQKVFNIQQGSYVDWTGDMLDPTLHISAVDKIKTSVKDESTGATNPVTFNAIVNVMNTLDNMQITFDLAAPDNSTVQGQLSSMNAEERSKQAMNLLLYNMYSGPGMSSTSSQMNATSILTSFVQSQVNDWARNTLKGVDISLGVDTYQEGTGDNLSQRTDYTYSFSKQLFNNRFKVKIGGSFSPDAQAQEKSIGQSFIDDVTLEYMLNKQGSAYLTLFHNTSYESILEGQIISTGIGVVYRKRMEMLRDLFYFGRKKDKQQTNEK